MEHIYIYDMVYTYRIVTHIQYRENNYTPICSGLTLNCLCHPVLNPSMSLGRLSPNYVCQDQHMVCDDIHFVVIHPRMGIHTSWIYIDINVCMYIYIHNYIYRTTPIKMDWWPSTMSLQSSFDHMPQLSQLTSPLYASVKSSWIRRSRKPRSTTSRILLCCVGNGDIVTEDEALFTEK